MKNLISSNAAKMAHDAPAAGLVAVSGPAKPIEWDAQWRILNGHAAGDKRVANGLPA